ncbi:pyrroloquinoline quinone precursor peptide PqqA [Paenibacillus chibensis]|uniref:pyrroloquinoline quinone precursor peptide PqqA n=1 Tax=Paenibacillus chibensis TaxID=59846 RepID=UPI00399CDF28
MPKRYIGYNNEFEASFPHERCRAHELQGGEGMWVKPEFEVVEVCAEVTAYAYQK